MVGPRWGKEAGAGRNRRRNYRGFELKRGGGLKGGVAGGDCLKSGVKNGKQGPLWFN